MGSFLLKLSPGAARDLDRLEDKVATHILHKLNVLKDDPFPRGKLVKKLKGTQSAFYRFRVDQYRVFYSIEGRDVVILRVISKKDAERFIGGLRGR